MTRGFSLTLILISALCSAQLVDDFNDGNIHSNPQWLGDTTKFTVKSGQLQSNSNEVSDVFYISTVSTVALETEWEIFVNMQFSTSSANYSDIYLISDSANLSNATNGYFVRVGNTKDEIALYLLSNGLETLLIDGEDNQTHNKEIRIKVTRDSAGKFELVADYSGGTQFSAVGSATDNSHLTSSYFGIQIKQSTSSFHYKHFFDDVYVGPFRKDTTNSYTPPYPGSVLINEIMADPSPSVLLPNFEFVELFNATNDTFDLKDCQFGDAGSSGVLPNYILYPNSYLIVCKSGNEANFTNYGKVIGLSGFPTLNNTGDHLILLDSAGAIIDSVTYSEAFYNDDTKSDGGYTLELISPNSTCPASQNWAASNDQRGGSPGIQNSWFGMKLDSIAPKIISTEIIAPSAALEFVLTETSNENEMLRLNNYTILETGENATFAYTLAAPKYVVEFTSFFEQNALYHLQIDNLEDCHGNSSTNTIVPLIFGSKPAKNDIVINELLFNPPTNGVDFIELYNNTDKFFDLSAMSLAKMEDGQRGSPKSITNETTFLYPNHFALLTEDSSRIKKDYPNAVSSAFIEVPDLPSMNNDRDTIVLLLNDILIDSVFYDDNQHFELLTSTDGVSLERLNYSSSSTNPGNWHSASASVGFATPGFQNSQFRDLSPSHTTFSLETSLFSPDGDGYEDQLILNYNTDNQGYTLNGYIFDLAGRLVAHPFNTLTIGSEGFITWDGITPLGTKARIGNYILLIEAFDLNGKITKKKLAFSVVGNF